MKLVEKNNKRINNRLMLNNVFKGLFFLATFFGIVVLAILVMRIVSQGASYLDWDFLSNYASRKAEDAGIKAAIYGTVWIMAIVAPVSLILGVGTAIYLEEYAPDNKFTHFIELNISNLSGVPSIVFGLLGLTVFVRLLEMGRSVLAGGLTMSLMILPVIVVPAKKRFAPFQRNNMRPLMRWVPPNGRRSGRSFFRQLCPASLPDRYWLFQGRSGRLHRC